mmetsp:Transcript_176122/g.559609  ORF Transcript_176122/g.559609 Transcript_176122/m.559609 type:complete len:264 (-) Transcript_176122:229-1020(-)
MARERGVLEGVEGVRESEVAPEERFVDAGRRRRGTCRGRGAGSRRSGRGRRGGRRRDRGGRCRRGRGARLVRLLPEQTGAADRRGPAFGGARVAGGCPVDGRVIVNEVAVSIQVTEGLAVFQGQCRDTEALPGRCRMAIEAAQVVVGRRRLPDPDLGQGRVVPVPGAQANLAAGGDVAAVVVVIHLATDPDVRVGALAITLVVHQQPEAASGEMRVDGRVGVAVESLPIAVVLTPPSGHQVSPSLWAQLCREETAGEHLHEGL